MAGVDCSGFECFCEVFNVILISARYLQLIINQSINHEFNNRLTNSNHTIEIYNGKTNCESNHRVKIAFGANIIQPRLI